ncbi:MAG: hypothetical protein ACJ8DC_14165 [Gemmatimonadales bacterium]
MSPESATPLVPADQGASDVTPAANVSLSTTSFAGGIPIGTFALPVSTYGSRYNGGSRNPSPSGVLHDLADIKARGGRVVLNLSGNPRYFKDASGHFSLDKWKQRVARFKGVNLSTYINDGTIIGHFLLDEPNDPANWNGRPVSSSTVDQMAQYSKQLWSGLTTIVRTEPSYFGTVHYLDAAWAQYVYRKGSADNYISRNVNDARNRGLQLVIGMNLLKGGPNGSKMSASEIKSWGTTLLNNSYSCAFISWTYDDNYLSNSSVKDAMDALRNKAENHSSKSCR